MNTMKYWLSFDAIVSIIPASLAPVMTMLISDKELSGRNIAIMVVGGIIGLFSALAAFRSTKFARANYNVTEKPLPAPMRE